MKRNSLANWIIAKFSKWLEQEEIPSRDYLSDFNRISFEVKQADVLLIEGRHRVSRIIRHITSSPWTHAALYIGCLHEIEDEKMRALVAKFCQCSPSSQLVIESILGLGTIISPLDKYRNEHVRICRPTGLSHNDTQRVINYTVNHLGRKYSMRHVLDLLRYLFPWGLYPRKWRTKLFEHNALKPTEEICSTLIAEAFTAVNFPILPLVQKAKSGLEFIHRNPDLFTPSDFDYSPYFAIIKYPIFPISELSSYRDLPWLEGVVSNDYTIIPNIRSQTTPPSK